MFPALIVSSLLCFAQLPQYNWGLAIGDLPDNVVIATGFHPQFPEGLAGEGKGKVRSLHNDYVKAHGTAYFPRNQGNAPSCVGNAVASGVDFLLAVEVARGHRGIPPPRASAEWVYGASREYGSFQNRGGGSYCGWAVKSLMVYGHVHQKDYSLLEIDLTEYSPQRAVDWGRKLPQELYPLAREFKLTVYYQLNSWENVRDAIACGYPVVVGSSQGFGATTRTLRRDRDGFLNPPRGLLAAGKRWNHAMLIIGASDTGRKGGLILNSWGHKWVDGPTRYGDEPFGSFWADSRIIDGMAKQGDCFAIVSVGY